MRHRLDRLETRIPYSPAPRPEPVDPEIVRATEIAYLAARRMGHEDSIAVAERAYERILAGDRALLSDLTDIGDEVINPHTTGPLGDRAQRICSTLIGG